MTRTVKLFSGSVLLACGLCLVSGCDPPPPTPLELGRIIYDESKAPGAKQTYQLPEYLRNLKPDDKEGTPAAE